MKTNLDLAAQILVEAAYKGDRETAKKFCITERTIRNYRYRLRDDPQLSVTLQIKKREFDQEWIREAPASIRIALDAIKNIAGYIGTTRVENMHPLVVENLPAMVHSLAGAIKIVSESLSTERILNARLSGPDRTDRTEDQPLVT